MFTPEEYKKLINIPIAVIIASFIIIIVTTSMTDKNAIGALIGGYSGLLLGMLFLLVLNWPPKKWLDISPFIVVLAIVSLIIYYLSTYSEKIVQGNVSSYYISFSILSTIFLSMQIITIVSSLLSNSTQIQTTLFSPKIFALLGLIGVINMLIVLTIGIILNFYSTQG
jgi:hypothetical protein